MKSTISGKITCLTCIIWVAMPSLGRIGKSITDRKYRFANSLITHDFFGSSELFGYYTSIGDLRSGCGSMNPCKEIPERTNRYLSFVIRVDYR